MNLGEATIVLRKRRPLELADLSLSFVRELAPRNYLVLSALFVLPAWLGCMALVMSGWEYPLVFFWALGLARLIELPYTLLCGHLLFDRAVTHKTILVESRSRFLPYVVGNLVYFALLVVSALLVVGPLLVAASMFFLNEIIALEKSGPLRALGRARRFLGNRGSAGFEGVFIKAAITVSFIFLFEVLGHAVVSTIFEMAEPVDSLWEQGGSPFALLGLFVAVPFAATYRFLSYTNQRTLRDGWDVQVAFLRLLASEKETSRAERENAS